MKAASNIEKLETHEVLLIFPLSCFSMEHAMSFQNGKARDLMEYQQQQQRLQQSMEELTRRETYLAQEKERLLQELRMQRKEESSLFIPFI